ncbi:MAG: sodium:proton antiporter [Reyranella sp.]|uniref:sodium:proton antiporter n=1 Tax=Reyranella sp. TaxID=1929291 RepID=UPI0012250F34|nr:sodium:proton antiporter [Reyranella sp.]TAJ38139.1 MAG: sodium:proton antiporter [Reyranella sp.]
MKRQTLLTILALAAAMFALPALAAGPDAPAIDGRGLSLLWIVPFAGILLSIAVMPLALPRFWHHHFGKVSAAWALMVIVPFAVIYGVPTAAYEIIHLLLLDYIPFIVLLLALFTVTGGIHIKGNMHGSPSMNTALLAVGTVLAGWMGTTGASMLLIRPVIRANDDRKHKIHVFVFFIFLVSNIGGALTPLGDPPLFLGFLKGVSFFWTTTNLFGEMLLCAIVLLGLFYAIDSYWYRKEGHLKRDPTPESPVRVEGGVNIILLAAIVGVVLASGTWNPGVHFTVFHVTLELQHVARDLCLVAICALSLKLTSSRLRSENSFSWGPMAEVAKLFAGIFITIAPAIAILKVGKDGAMAPLVALVTNPDGQPNDIWYFWLTGILSSFLDNAPTYLVFFNLAGGDANVLMGALASTLAAISCGAVFMGANTYIGNAPNFMVKAVVEESGIRMPSFFGYMAWSCAILVPLFVLVTVVFFQ